MPGDPIRLLALDGGGVRGLSSRIILRQLMETVNFESPPKKSRPVTIKGRIQDRFDAAELERTVKQILKDRGFAAGTLLKDLDARCKIFVCAASKQTGDIVCLTSYRYPRGSTDLFEALAYGKPAGPQRLDARAG